MEFEFGFDSEGIEFLMTLINQFVKSFEWIEGTDGIIKFVDLN